MAAAAYDPVYPTFIKVLASSTDMDDGIPKFYRFILQEFKKKFDMKMLEEALADWRGDLSFRAIIAYKCGDEDKLNRVSRMLVNTDDTSIEDIKTKIIRSINTLDLAFKLISELIIKYKDDIKHEADYEEINDYFIVYRGTNNISETTTHYRAPYIPTTYSFSDEHYLSFSDKNLYMRLFVPKDTPFFLTGIESELLLPSNSRIYVLHDKSEKVPSKEAYFYDSIMEYPASFNTGEPQWCRTPRKYSKKKSADKSSDKHILSPKNKKLLENAMDSFINDECMGLDQNEVECLDEFKIFFDTHPHYTDKMKYETSSDYEQRKKYIKDIWDQQIRINYRKLDKGEGIVKHKMRKRKLRKRKIYKHKTRKHKTRKHKTRKHKTRLNRKKQRGTKYKNKKTKRK